MTMPPDGDPVRMRLVAGALVHCAGRVADASHGVDVALATMVYEGPAADRVRAELLQDRLHAELDAQRLEQLARSLLAAADQLEQAIVHARRAGSG